MSIYKKDELKMNVPFKGAKSFLLTGKETGSKMMSVSQIVLETGSKSPLYKITNVEESIFIAKGQLKIRLDNKQFDAYSGDCVLAKQNDPHGYENNGKSDAIIITVSPSTDVETVELEEIDYIESKPDFGFFDRSINEPYEFAKGIMRYDMIGDFLGAKSTYFSELIFEPGAIAPNHYHPRHEESMFCLENKLNCVYADDDNISLSQGDIFMAEVAVRHGIFNGHKSVGKLLAIHSVLNPPPRVDVD
ncbi:uncharacterized protein METZ01_LOCUS283043 [marine metagenome]|uniref:Cupin type-2 domain-containing protein n=1 Tax=marine metagenome TaxID=408172 RepID=A0A382L0R7_9ZZZZ